MRAAKKKATGKRRWRGSMLSDIVLAILEAGCFATGAYLALEFFRRYGGMFL